MNLTTMKQTMSSREIAELTGKRHDNVIVDIEKMLNELEIGAADFASSYLSEQNKELKCYNLPGQYAFELLNGYGVRKRSKIKMDRKPLWEMCQDLEKIINICGV